MTNRPFNGIKAVFFDAGHTFLWPEYDALAKFMSDYYGEQITPAKLMLAEQKFRAAIIPPFEMQNDELIPIPHNSCAYYRALVKGCLGHVDQRHFHSFAVQAHARHMRRNWFSSLARDAIQAFDMLKEYYNLCVISNAQGTLERDLAQLGVRDYFTKILDSAVEGISKPDPEIFRRALTVVHGQADKAVHVGDHLEADVQGALNAGLHAVLFDGHGIYKPGDYPNVPYCRSLVELAEMLIPADPF